jgi:hypothetical protein
MRGPHPLAAVGPAGLARVPGERCLAAAQLLASVMETAAAVGDGHLRPFVRALPFSPACPSGTFLSHSLGDRALGVGTGRGQEVLSEFCRKATTFHHILKQHRQVAHLGALGPVCHVLNTTYLT